MDDVASQNSGAETVVSPQKGNIANLTPWQPGKSGNPGGRPKAHAMISALFDLAAKEGKAELAVHEYFELMLHANDARLRFDVLRDFFDRIGLPRVTDNPKMTAQIVNVVRSNSPELNL